VAAVAVCGGHAPAHQVQLAERDVAPGRHVDALDAQTSVAQQAQAGGLHPGQAGQGIGGDRLDGDFEFADLDTADLMRGRARQHRTIGQPGGAVHRDIDIERGIARDDAIGQCEGP